MYQRRRQRGTENVSEINVTAFMNLMVVLVPFLLILAVFSRVTIHELNMPSDGDSAQDGKPKLQLEVVMLGDRLVVADRSAGAIASLRNTDAGYDLNALSERLQRIKARFPDEVGVVILLEPQIAYDDLIQVMDTVREFRRTENGKESIYELFPEISLGDAPAASRQG